MRKMILIPVVFATYCIQYIAAEDLTYLNQVESLNNKEVLPNLKKFFRLKQKFDESLTDVDPCIDNPCKNNGKCTVKDKGFECSCLEPFFGKICEKDPCTDDPCVYGICEVNVRGFKCICAEDFFGERCEKNLCTDACKNNGSCKIIDNPRYPYTSIFKCMCKRPYTGERCEIETCPHNPCKNEGNCTVINKKLNCSCPEPFSGKYCEVCCVNGRCRWAHSRSPIKYKCECDPGYGLLSAGVCKECDCGGNVNCIFRHDWSGYQKICVCPFGYGQVDGLCKDCGCGGPTQARGCTFSEDGKKKCYCTDHHAESNGKCVECGCGRYYESTGCSFTEDGKKECQCEDHYLDINGVCVEIIKTTTEITTGSSAITQETTVQETSEKFTEVSTLTSEEASSSTASGLELCNSICGDHGKCVVEGSQYSCKCDTGYKGFNCDEEHSPKIDDTQIAYIVVPVVMLPLMLFSGFMAYRYRS